MDYWMDNATGGKHVLVDMGSANTQSTRDATDRVRKHVGRSNVQINGSLRVLVRIPPTKMAKVMSAFPEIKVGETYCWCTHHWKERPCTQSA